MFYGRETNKDVAIFFFAALFRKHKATRLYQIILCVLNFIDCQLLSQRTISDHHL